MTQATAKTYSFAEEIAHTSTHGLGVLAGLVAMVFLVEKAARTTGSDVGPMAAAGIYGASIVMLYACSTLYHGSFESRFQPFFKMLDHSAIYIKIAGTYTPIAVLALPWDIGLPVLVSIWGLAALGVVFKVVGFSFAIADKFRWISLATYLGMGWAGIFIAGDVYESLSHMGLVWLGVGAGFFTIGAMIYAAKSIPWSHTIWHVCVLGGSVSHFLMVYGEVL